MPDIHSWIPTIVISSIAFLWLIGTLVYWFKNRDKITEQERRKTDVYIGLLNRLEDALIQFRLSSEQLLKQAEGCTLEEYSNYLKNNILFKQNLASGEHNAVIKALIARRINPRLQELQENNEQWKNAKEKLIKLSTKTDKKLNRAIEAYINVYQITDNIKIIAQLGNKYIMEDAFDFKQRHELETMLREYDGKLAEIYGIVIEHIKKLRQKRR